MERGRGGRDGPFGAGDPFAGFGRLGAPMPGLFGGGRNPFDDPFFTQPFGGRDPFAGPGMFGGPGLFGPMGGPAMFGAMGGPGMFGAFGAGDGGFLEQAPPARSGDGGGPVITEIDEDEEEGDGDAQANRGVVQEPDDGNDGMQGGQVQLRRDPNRASGGGQPQSRSFTYQSSTVTYGGMNGAYYTASKSRRSGSDGITVEESKEADTTTKEATHRISRGIHDKGHSVTRKLKSDGKMSCLYLKNHGRAMLDNTYQAGTRMLVYLMAITLVTVVPTVAGSLHRTGRSLERSNTVIKGGALATRGSQSHRGSSQSPEECREARGGVMGGSKSRFIPRSRAEGMAESTEQTNKALLACASSSAPGARSSS